MDYQNFSPQKTIVIHNPLSGRKTSQELAMKVVQQLNNLGYEVVKTKTPGQAKRMGAEASERGWEALICIGGDGTLFETIAEAPPVIPIGFYPSGTINLLAKSLSIPEAPESWLALLKKSTLKNVYLGRANGRLFASVGSVGFDARVVARVSPWLKKWFHEGAYGIQSLLELLPYKFPKYTVTIDGNRVEDVVLGVLIGKGPYFAGPHPILRHADHCVPKLCVGLLGGNSKEQLLRYAWGLARGTLGEMEGMKLCSAQELIVESDPVSHVELDGEPYGNTPAIFKIESTTRRVLAP